MASCTNTHKTRADDGECVCVSAYCSEFQIGRHKDRKSAVRDGGMDCVTVCQEQEIHSASIFQDSERERERGREREGEREK